jgi:hypothetical protein
MSALGRNVQPQSTDAREQTLYTLRATHAGLTYYWRSERKLPATLHEICDREPVWCASDEPDRWFRDGWRTIIRYVPHGQEYVLSSAGPDRRFDTQDDIVFDSAIDRQRAKDLSGCYVLSETLARTGSDTLRLSSQLSRLFGYAVEWPVTVDSTRAFVAVWYPGPGDTVHAIWIHVDNGFRLEGTIVGGRLKGRVGTQTVTGRKLTC